MRKFEYLKNEEIVHMIRDEHKTMNDLGAEGWELIPIFNGNGFLGKREITEDMEKERNNSKSLSR